MILFFESIKLSPRRALAEFHFFPFYLYKEFETPGTYSMRDLFSGTMDIICITIGVIALGKGLACGDGGPMQAIEN